MNFWKKADTYPPILVRLLARVPHGRPLTDAEIAERSGLPVAQVWVISCSTTWDGIDVPTMRRFVQACHVDIEDDATLRRVESYMRSKPTWLYLRKSSQWKSYFETLSRMYRKAMTKSLTRNPTPL